MFDVIPSQTLSSGKYNVLFIKKIYGQKSVTLSLTVFSEPVLSLATSQAHRMLNTPSVQTHNTVVSVLRPLGEWTIELQQHKYEHFATAEQQAADAMVQRAHLQGC